MGTPRSWPALALLVLACGCAERPEPVIPKAAFADRQDSRVAVEGRDSTVARISWVECVGARTPTALDSLRAVVQALAVAPAGRRRTSAASVAALLDGFIAEWNAERQAARRHMFWRLERRIEAIADTLGVVSFARTDFEYTGGARPVSRVTLVSVDADSGRTLGFADFFRADLRDSLSDAVRPVLRAARGLSSDTSRVAGTLVFPDSAFRLNDNLALVDGGVRWHFAAGEIAPYAFGPTDFVAPFDVVRAYAREGGPLWRKWRR